MILTISVGKDLIDAIDRLVDKGFFTSRSEFFRHFGYEGLNKTIRLEEKLKAVEGKIVGDKVIYNGKIYKIKGGDQNGVKGV